MREYLSHCPDCMVLPTVFPTACTGPILAALRGQIEDVKCVVHCGITLAAWGANLWIGDGGIHPHAAKAVVAAPNFEAAAAELEKAVAKHGEGTADQAVAALDWKLILTAILALIQKLLS